MAEQAIVVDGVPHLGPPQSAAGTRVMALEETTAEILRAHWHAQTRRLAGAGREPTGICPHTPIGG